MMKFLRSNRVDAPSPDDLDESVQEETCTPSKCVHDRKKKRFDCTTCKRSVHYSCTELPAYYIQLIVCKEVKFICVNCVEIPKTLKINRPTNEEVKTLKRDVENCENIIRVKEEKKKELESTVNSLKNEVKNLKGKLKTDPALHTVEYMEEKFEKKIQDMGKEIKTSIVDELKTLLAVPKQNSTYASAVGRATEPPNRNTIKSIIQETRNAEVAEDKDKKRRALNIIVHGVPEPRIDAAAVITNEDHDARFVDQLIRDLHVRVSTKKVLKVSRIGKPDNGKTRPIKVIMADEESKTTIFQNLANLKQHETYKGIGLTDDYTPAERELLKEWANRARVNTEQDKENIYRVRGSPKNKLWLKKFPKQTNPQ